MPVKPPRPALPVSYGGAAMVALLGRWWPCEARSASVCRHLTIITRAWQSVSRSAAPHLTGQRVGQHGGGAGLRGGSSARALPWPGGPDHQFYNNTFP